MAATSLLVHAAAPGGHVGHHGGLTRDRALPSYLSRIGNKAFIAASRATARCLPAVNHAARSGATGIGTRMRTPG
jgi:hypothetical protein